MVEIEVIGGFAIWATGFIIVLLMGLIKWIPRMHPKRKAIGYLLAQSVLWPVTAYVALSEWYERPWK